MTDSFYGRHFDYDFDFDQYPKKPIKDCAEFKEGPYKQVIPFLQPTSAAALLNMLRLLRNCRASASDRSRISKEAALQHLDWPAARVLSNSAQGLKVRLAFRWSFNANEERADTQHWNDEPRDTYLACV